MPSYSRNGQLVQIWEKELIRAYDHINWSHRLKLVRPTILISSANSYFGQWDPLLRQIKISETLIKNYKWFVVLEILKHEIAHQMETDITKTSSGHGPAFQAHCDSLGVHPYFRRAQLQIKLTDFDISSAAYLSKSDADTEGDRLLQRINRLFSVGSSSNEFEAKNALRKAYELSEKYNQYFADVQLNEKNFQRLIIEFGKSRLLAFESVIASILLEHFSVEVILSTMYCPNENVHNKVLELYGLAENLKIAEYVYHFLGTQVKDLWDAFKAKNNCNSKLKRSFQLGVLNGFIKTLRESKMQETATGVTLTNKSLIIQENRNSLLNYVRKHHPRLRQTKVETGRVHSKAYAEGSSAGSKIQIHKGLHSEACAKKPGLITY